MVQSPLLTCSSLLTGYLCVSTGLCNIAGVSQGVIHGAQSLARDACGFPDRC